MRKFQDDSVAALGGINLIDANKHMAFIPEVMTPQQFSWLNSADCKSPEQKLCEALIFDAVAILCNKAAQRRKNKRTQFIEAQQWIQSDFHQPGSFIWCCEGIGLNYHLTRKRLGSLTDEWKRPPFIAMGSRHRPSPIRERVR